MNFWKTPQAELNKNTHIQKGPFIVMHITVPGFTHSDSLIGHQLAYFCQSTGTVHICWLVNSSICLSFQQTRTCEASAQGAPRYPEEEKHVKNSIIWIGDLADEAILINEVTNTALNDSVPGRPCLAIRELKGQTVEVIIPEGKML